MHVSMAYSEMAVSIVIFYSGCAYFGYYLHCTHSHTHERDNTIASNYEDFPGECKQLHTHTSELKMAFVIISLIY